jgi:TRAP-type C4-dicarboxylate transport system substrate-binding protein
MIKTNSNGRLTIRIYPIGTLIAPPDIRLGIKEGIADMGSSTAYKWDEKFTIGVNLTSLIRCKDPVTAAKIYDEVWEEFPDLMAHEWEDFKVIAFTGQPPIFLATQRVPVRKLEDVSGLQLRVTQKEQADFISSLGGIPVQTSPIDYVLGLQKHTVSGGCTTVAMPIDFKMGPLLGYYTWYSFGGGFPVFLIMNKDSWNKLPPDLQKVIDDTREWVKQEGTKAWQDAMPVSIKYMTDSGIEMIFLSPEELARWDAKTEPIYGNIKATLNQAGLPGDEIVDFVVGRSKYYWPITTVPGLE